MRDSVELLRFADGTGDDSYEYLGVHREDKDYVFRVWAPRADTVSVVGDFIGWNDGQRMTPVGNGVWEAKIFADSIREGQFYKYKIKSGERIFYKADPYAVCAGCPPETASVIFDISKYKWRDEGWLSYRRKKAGAFDGQPINIYHLNVMLWKRHSNGKPYSWSELATELSTYVKQMGYTHIELMPIAEYFSEASLGYRVDSFFSPTARLGDPFGFMGFVDSMHEAGIGIIIDWIPTHFSSEEYSLAEFDGQPLYECGKDGLEKESLSFDLARNEVKSFLTSNAMFWLRVYHIDGLSVLCGNGTSEALSFCAELQARVKDIFPDVYFDTEYGETLLLNLPDHCGASFAERRLNIGAGLTCLKPRCPKTVMGMEIGQGKFGDNIAPVEWSLLDNADNARLQYYVSELNHFYLKSPLLFDLCERIEIRCEGVTALRHRTAEDKSLTVVLNHTDEFKADVEIPVCKEGGYKTVFCSEDARFGGSGGFDERVLASEDGKIRLDLQPFAMMILQITEDKK